MPRTPSPRSWIRPCSCLLAACLSLGTAAPVQAQVYKCQQGSQTSYQSTPCVQGRSSQVAIAPGPSASEVEQAQIQAAREKARADAIALTRSRPTNTVSPADAKVPPPVSALRPARDCESLARLQGEAWGRHNAAVRQGRQTNDRGY
ncbi:MAG TPA: hypothetical protein VK195_06025, partial [Burkholderiaceae bacterium]|nr:hypothetical protein [Burkholderiaceae bacterium]